jgi:transposase
MDVENSGVLAGTRSDRQKVRRRGKEWSPAEGKAVMADWAKSGQALAEYCRTRGLSYHRLYRWRRKLGASASIDSPPKIDAFASVKVVESRAMPTSLTGYTEESCVLEIIVRNGRRIRIGRDFDARALSRLLAVVEEGQAC